MGIYRLFASGGTRHQSFLRVAFEPDDLQQTDRRLYAEYAEIHFQVK